MRMQLSRWLFRAALVAPIALGVSVASAQPQQRDHRKHGPGGAVTGTVSVDIGPTEAPPPPREERHDANPGHVWIDGQWDWKAGKWDWVPGHWERERAGKRWRGSKWEQHDGHWKRVEGGWEASAATPPPPPVTPPPTTTTAEPTAPPPPRRDEKHDATRAGYVWIDGQWDWNAGKWDWVAGHWEREQAGKRWRPHRWEQKDGHWARSEGGWEDANAATPPPPPPGPPPTNAPHGHRDWKLDRPTISSYWPVKGKAGSRIVIRGKNFPANAQVLLGGQPITGAKIKPDQIVVVLPATAASGELSIKTGARRDLAVGNFEVAASYDPVAEQKRIEEEQHKAAEAAWNARQAALAKNRAAREAAIKQRQEEMMRTREDRRARRIAEIQAKWDAAFLADPDTQSELTLHAQRLATIERMRDLADINANAKLAVRIEVAQSREDQRHQQRMDALHASFKM